MIICTMSCFTKYKDLIEVLCCTLACTALLWACLPVFLCLKKKMVSNSWRCLSQPYASSRWSPWCRASRSRWSCCSRWPLCSPSSPAHWGPVCVIIVHDIKAIDPVSIRQTPYCEINVHRTKEFITNHPCRDTELSHLLLVAVGLGLIAELLW